MQVAQQTFVTDRLARLKLKLSSQGERHDQHAIGIIFGPDRERGPVGPRCIAHFVCTR